MPEKRRGSVRARLSVWFSRVQRLAERFRAGARGPRCRRGRTPRARPGPRPGGATPASSCWPRRGRATRPRSRTPHSAPRPPTFAPRFFQWSRPGDHQVQDQEELALEREHDPLADPREPEDAPALRRPTAAARPSAAGRGFPGAPPRGACPGRGLRERSQVRQDVRQLRHAAQLSWLECPHSRNLLAR